jgi:nucleotide-binding universal stress UspA family protein
MIEWRRICCAVDFDAPSRAALEQAADLARRFEAELILVHALPSVPRAASDVLVSSRGAVSAQADEAVEKLQRWREEAERRSGRPVDVRVLRGDPPSRIVKLVRDARCDLVVLGTHGRRGLPRLVAGSVAERVARLCERPVLVVREAEEEGIAQEAALYG